MNEDHTLDAARARLSSSTDALTASGMAPLKGAAGAVLTALRNAGRYARRNELMAWTGYGTNSVSRALRRLTDLGLVTSRTIHGPWLAVPAGEPQRTPHARPNARFAPVLPPPTSSSPPIEGGAEDREQEEEGSAHFAQCHRALMQAGIREPAASKIASTPGITLVYIDAHVKAAEGSEYGLGMAVYRMLRGWPAPARKNAREEEDPDKQRQRDVEEKIRKFLEGR